MKRLFALLCCTVLITACAACSSCNNANRAGTFVFLSVRLKGNGDGTVTAVAQNEFTLGSTVMPVKLTLYRIDDGAKTEVDCIFCEDLNLFSKLSLTAEVVAKSSFSARIDYSVNGESDFIECAPVNYGTDGKRI